MVLLHVLIYSVVVEVEVGHILAQLVLRRVVGGLLAAGEVGRDGHLADGALTARHGGRGLRYVEVDRRVGLAQGDGSTSGMVHVPVQHVGRSTTMWAVQGTPAPRVLHRDLHLLSASVGAVHATAEREAGGVCLLLLWWRAAEAGIHRGGGHTSLLLKDSVILLLLGIGYAWLLPWIISYEGVWYS